MELETAQRIDAFRILLRRCLAVTASDVVLVLFDEAFTSFHDAFLSAAASLDVIPTEVFLPARSQLAWIDRGCVPDGFEQPGLPVPLKQALSVSDVIINVLGGNLKTTPMRRALLQGPRPDDSRFAHVPGLSDEILDLLLRSPLDEICRTSECVAWALGNAEQAVLSTCELDGRVHELHIKLEGWDNPPFMSPGVIPAGSWGNVTPGESFSCPDPAWINGTVCINGALPDIVLAPDEEVVLQFNAGHLADWRARSGSPAPLFFAEQKRLAANRDDSRWDVLAELGIGLNPVIRELTGIQQFDEKASDTVHIAIGDNSVFGHPNSSRIHVDLITRNASLLLDGFPLIECGRSNVTALAKLRTRHPSPTKTVPSGSVVFLRRDRYLLADTSVYVRSRKGGRVTLIQMAQGGYGDALARAVTELETYDDVSVLEFCSHHGSFCDIPSRSLLDTLYHYRVLGIASVA